MEKMETEHKEALELIKDIYEDLILRAENYARLTNEEPVLEISDNIAIRIEKLLFKNEEKE